MFGYFGYKPPIESHDNPIDPRYGELSDQDLMLWRYKFIFEMPSTFEPVDRDQVVDMEHILKEIDIYIRLIRNYSNLSKEGAELDTGVIFYGPPGSGKTYCARYLAAASQARFININDFPKRKRFEAKDIEIMFGLMKQFVKENRQPIVAFWDEFDTFTNAGDNADKQEALSRFKTELSGVNGKLDGIFIIAATNQPSLVPGDVVRPGRLGKKVRFEALRRHAKQRLLEYFVNKYKHAENIDFESLSFLIPADYPADIEELIKDAWRNISIESIDSPEERCLTDANLATTLIKQARGTPSDIVLSNAEIRAISIYEVGRAIIARTLKYPVQLIAIQKEGYDDAYRITKNEHSSHRPLSGMKNDIAVCYGGIIAQSLFEIETNTKHLSDFNIITITAQKFVEQCRSAKTSAISISMLAGSRAEQGLPPIEGYGMRTMDDSIDEMNKLLEQQQMRVRAIFEHYGHKLVEEMTKKLIEKGFLLQMDIDAVLEPGFQPQINSEKIEKRIAGF